jgi:(1->4)-alpha-D-glucan 1-alpha-D-glucosylmutase
MWNSLAQVLLKVAAPGVPDFYQGTELWDFSLVDPDNRRPVDYETRAQLLEGLGPLDEPLDDEAMAASWPSGSMAASSCTWPRAALRARRRAPGALRAGAYRPIEATGRQRGPRVRLRARARRRQAALVVVPRLTDRARRRRRTTPPVGETCGATRGSCCPTTCRPDVVERVHARSLRRGRAPRELRVADLLATCPVALLLSGA